jgi:hypothetical protein
MNNNVPALSEKEQVPVQYQPINQLMAASPIPNVDFNQGILGNLLQQWKFKSLAKAQEERTKAVSSWISELKIYLEASKAVTIYSEQVADAFDELRHKKEMRKQLEEKGAIENERGKIDNEKIKAEIMLIFAQARVEDARAKQIENEAKLTDAEYQAMIRDIEEAFNGTE